MGALIVFSVAVQFLSDQGHGTIASLAGPIFSSRDVPTKSNIVGVGPSQVNSYIVNWLCSRQLMCNWLKGMRDNFMSVEVKVQS